MDDLVVGVSCSCRADVKDSTIDFVLSVEKQSTMKIWRGERGARRSRQRAIWSCSFLVRMMTERSVIL